MAAEMRELSSFMPLTKVVIIQGIYIENLEDNLEMRLVLITSVPQCTFFVKIRRYFEYQSLYYLLCLPFFPYSPRFDSL